MNDLVADPMNDLSSCTLPLQPRRAPFRAIGLMALAPVVFACLFPCFVSAQDVPIPQAPTRWVTDTAGFMAPQAAEALDARLRAYEEQTKHQLLVWIGRTTGDVPIEDWANRAFEQWKVGRKGIDDGLVLFIMAEDRRLRFEVGYGLEVQVPDLLAKRIIDNVIVPQIRAGDPAAGVAAGLEAVAAAIGTPLGGQSMSTARRTGRTGREARPITLGQIILYGIIGIIALVVFATNPQLATWLLLSMLSSGGGRHRGGGGWSGGGGFSGGGGRSGGGGASGSW